MRKKPFGKLYWSKKAKIRYVNSRIFDRDKCLSRRGHDWPTDDGRIFDSCCLAFARAQEWEKGFYERSERRDSQRDCPGRGRLHSGWVACRPGGSLRAGDSRQGLLHGGGPNHVRAERNFLKQGGNDLSDTLAALLGVPASVAQSYEESIRGGCILVCIQAGDMRECERAAQVFQRYEAGYISTSSATACVWGPLFRLG